MQKFQVIQVTGVDAGILVVVREPDCLKVNSRAISFYLRLGFKRRGDIDTHVVMERPLLNDDLL
ncbi:MAG: hypothetical protein AB1585_09505 [Thermodesulfobacteriota bacterium]